MLLVLLVPDFTAAQEIDGFIELSTDRTARATETVEGDVVESQRLSLFQRYSLDLNWRLYPNLQFRAGGLFEVNDGRDAGDGDSFPDLKRERLRPYLSLALRTPLYTAEAGYVRLDERVETVDRSLAEIQDTFDVVLGWRPENFPEWRLRFQDRSAYDSERIFRDLEEQLVDLTVDYTFRDALRLYYRGGLQTSSNRLEDLQSELRSQNGRASYFDQFWGNRIQFNADYNVNDQEVKTRGQAPGGEVAVPVPALSGLSLLSEFPEAVVLEPNPAVIDNDRTSPTGIDLGLPPLGGDDRPRHIGLQFDGPLRVDTLRVWVDRDLPPLIASFFRWEVYASDDNRLWELRAQVVEARFGGPLDPRFELQFQELEERFIKVVVRPLDRTVPLADEFPNIQVTELEAFDRRPVGEGETVRGQTTQRLTSALRTQLLPNRALYHELSYSGRRTTDATTFWLLSNGLSFREQLSPTYVISARVAREDGEETTGSRVSYPYSASVRANWMPSLRQTLVISGREEEFEGEGGGQTSTRSVFLQTFANFYKGVRMDLGVGVLANEGPGEQRSDSTRVNANATLVPHRTMSVNLQYSWRNTVDEGPLVDGIRDRDISLSQVSMSYTPMPAIYLFGSYRLQTETDSVDRTFKNYGFSWSPLSSGDLQLSFSYNESFRSEFDSLFRVLSARSRWNITNRWFLDLVYEGSRADSDNDVRDTDIVRFGTRYVF